jgi:hypothetical protein
MSTPAARSTGSKPAFERRVAGLFGLKGDNWLRHANPLSVWTRFAVVRCWPWPSGAATGSAGGRWPRWPPRSPS